MRHLSGGILAITVAALLAFCSIPIASALTLEEAVDLSLRHNRDIRLAEEKVEENRTMLEKAVREYYPNLGLEGNFTHLGKVPTSQGIPIGPQDSAEISLGLRQPLYLGGRLSLGQRLAALLVRQAKGRLARTRTVTVYQTREAFFSVLLAEQNLAIARESLEYGQSHLEVVESFFQSGRAARFDLLRARVQVANLKPRVTDAENRLQLAREALAILLNIDAGEITVAGDLPYRPVDITLEEAVRTALVHREDLRSLEIGEEVSSLSAALERASLNPAVNLATAYSYSWAGNTGSWDDMWSLTVSLSFPIYDSGRVQARVEERQSQERQAKIAATQLRDAVILEVRRAFWDMQAAEEQLAAQRLNIEQAKEALAIATSRYAEGSITQTELMDAQLAVTEAELGRASALHSHALARAALAKAVGTNLNQLRGGDK